MDMQRARAGLAALLLVAGVSACGGAEEEVGGGEAGFLHGAGGVHTQVGEVLLRDVSIDEPEGSAYRRGDVARLRVTLFNQAEQPDALVGVRSTAAGDIRILVDRDCDGTFESSGEVALPATPAVRTPAPGVPDGPEVNYLVGLRIDQEVDSGSFVPVTFVFRNAGTTTVQVPVELTGRPLQEDDAACEPAV